MSALNATRSAQWLNVASFTYNIATGDTLANSSGVVQALGATGAGPFDCIKLPLGARVVGGDLVVTVVGNDSGVQTLSVGDSGSAARYLGATSIKALARTALVPTGFLGAGEDIRITLVNTNGDATTGKVTVNVFYTVEGKADLVVPN